MANPTREDLDKAWHLEGATPAIIAEALAAARADGANEALEKAAQLVSDQCGFEGVDVVVEAIRALKDQSRG